MRVSFTFIGFLFTTVLAGDPVVDPEPYPGFKMIFSDTFDGKRLDITKWDFDYSVRPDGQQQTYTNLRANCRVGGGTLAIIPLNDNGKWTSCRVKSVQSFPAPKGGELLVSARLKLGKVGADLQGMWPAFWALGESCRTGKLKWPECGEIDTFENINANAYGYSALHCGAACNEGSGLSVGTLFSYGDFHVWSHKIDLTNNDWKKQSITWYLDGKQYHVVYGSQSGGESVWENVARSAMYLNLNVAVGGGWPGNANQGTATGKYGGMQVDYVAVYESV